MRTKIEAVVTVGVVLWSTLALAGPNDEAAALKDEAVKVLKKGSAMEIDPKQYAECVVKLEKALDLLEGAGVSDSPLYQEINSSLYWARKFTTLNIINEIAKQHGTAPLVRPETKPVAPVAPVKPSTPEAVEEAESAALVAAKKLIAEGSTFAAAHGGDDYAIALRWFQIADQLTGTDLSLRALSYANAAQARHAAKDPNAKQETLPDTPAMALVKEGDALVRSGKLEESFALYKASIAKENTIHGHRHLAHAYFQRAQQIKEELMPLFEASRLRCIQARKDATRSVRTMSGTVQRFDPNNPGWLDALREQAELLKRAKGAFGYYDKSSDEFRAVLNSAQNGKDLAASGHIALCVSVRGDTMMRMRGIQLLNEFLSTYKPLNDVERTLYAYCKTELDRISKR